MVNTTWIFGIHSHVWLYLVIRTMVLAIFPIIFTMFWDLMHSSICRATPHTLSQMSSGKTYLGKRPKDGLID
jgi:hypothetical protein